MTEDHPALPSNQRDSPGPAGYRGRRVPGLPCVPLARRGTRPACLGGGSRLARVAVPWLAAAFAAVLAACSSGGGGPAGHPAGHAATSARPRASAAAMPTGAQLGQLLGHVRPPAGWTFEPGAGNGQLTSGTMYEIAGGPPASQDSCTTLNTNVSSMAVVAWWASTFDTLELMYPADPANLPQLNVTVGLYKPGYAARTMTFLQSLIGRCHSFRDKHLDNDPVTTGVQTIPHLGAQNLFLTSVEHTSAGTVTAHMILVRSGNDMVGVDSNTALGGDVRPATLQGFAYWMLQVLQSKLA